MSSDERPLRVYAISPSFKGEEELEYDMKGHSIQINVPELDDYVVVILQYERLPKLVHLIDKLI